MGLMEEKMTGYAFTHNGSVFTPEGKSEMTPAQSAWHNEMLEADELSRWATAPDTACHYVKGSKLVTWLGTELGTITYRNIYSTRLGLVEAIRVKGTNGASYYGRHSADWSEFVNLRKCKR